MCGLKLGCHLEVAADALWPQLLAFEAHAAGLPAVRVARTLSGTDDGRVTEWAILLRGSTLRWTQTERVDPAAKSVEFELLRGDPRFVAGRWSLRPHRGGTAAEVAVDIDFGLPRIGVVFNTLLISTLTEVLQGLVRSAERATSEQASRPADVTGRARSRDGVSEVG